MSAVDTELPPAIHNPGEYWLHKLAFPWLNQAPSLDYAIEVADSIKEMP